MASYDLCSLSWTLEGWRPFSWMLGKSMETGSVMVADLGPYPVRWPGTVQQALLQGGALPDWRVGVNSRLCEWVEHRHWIAETTIPAGWVTPGAQVILDAESLDYSGWILVDCKQAARFECAALLPQRIDLTDALGDGLEHRLAIVFEEPPREQGQIGFTSKSRFFKPRYNYSWDWCPRLVPIGVWGQLRLLTDASSTVQVRRVRSGYTHEQGLGSVTVDLAVGSGVDAWEVRILDGDSEIARASTTGSQSTLTLDAIPVKAWWPNGLGESKTYVVEITASALGECCLHETRQVGFRQIAWQACEGAPPDAEPWICVVNDVPLFLQGVNWSPIKTNYQDVAQADYEKRIRLYREMGCTLLRVWGGAMLESETFYDLCDRAGLLVWQEFPLSSSGVENTPPDAPLVLDTLEAIARSYVRRRAHHPSLLLWCGGNELYYGVSETHPPCLRPIDRDHPCIELLARVVAEEDPARRFLPGSPSGPVDYALDTHYGQGIHHDVHGPWGQRRDPDLEKWRDYWKDDDALFRSEVGMPGAMDAELIVKYAGGMDYWPPEGEFWMHTSAWWIQWGDSVKAVVAGLEGEGALRAYVEYTQRMQADLYALAAHNCRSRFPRCGGFLLWMGHDCHPCPSNNSILDVEGNPKPAWEALRKVFRA